MRKNSYKILFYHRTRYKILFVNLISVSSYRTAVDNAVLKLAESGKLVELKNRWWEAPDTGGCEVFSGFLEEQYFAWI